MEPDDKQKDAKESPTVEKETPAVGVSSIHQTGTDLVSTAYKIFPKELTDAGFKKGLSTTMVGFNYTQEKGKNEISLNSGVLTDWTDKQGKDHTYTDATRQRFLTTMTAAKTITLPKNQTLAFTAAGVMATGDKNGPPISYLNPEVKYNGHAQNCALFVGVGGITGDHVAKKQVYVTGGASSGPVGAQANFGVVEFQTGTDRRTAPLTDYYGVRGMLSAYVKPNDHSKVQTFLSIEEHSNNTSNQNRYGAIYETNIGKANVRATAIRNSRAGDGVENINVRAEIPVNLSQQGRNSLDATVIMLAGCMNDLKEPKGCAQPTYSVGVKVGVKHRTHSH